MSSKDEVVKSVPQNGFVGHPKGLFTLFSQNFGNVSRTMVCEQFSSSLCITNYMRVA